MLKYSVGLDVSSKSINGCLSSIDKGQKVNVKSTQTFPNSKTGFKSMDSWIKKNRKDKNVPLVICMEATGNYHESCALYLFERAIPYRWFCLPKRKTIFDHLVINLKTTRSMPGDWLRWEPNNACLPGRRLAGFSMNSVP